MRRLAALYLLLCPLFVWGQMWDRLATTAYRIDSSKVRQLDIEADILTFFRDNEYSSKLTRGYSLPGLLLQPKLTYAPLKNIWLEVGAHALIFNGANRYPCYVYHDIATWKGNQYQRGAHVLPWVRAQAQFKYLTIVLGDIYGGQNHRLVEPLFNPETNLSQDPEMGFQLLWDRPHLHVDTWMNWQSYIFEEDSHQEAFTVGSNWHVLYGDQDRPLRFSTPIQLLFHHRGGEQDTTQLGVQTVCNAAVGVQMDWMTNRKTLTGVSAEFNTLACYQQSGKLWPFNTGLAFQAAATVNLWNKLMLKGGYFHAPRHFVSLYGSPFFSTVSIRAGESFQGIGTAYVRADYHHTFSRNYVLGAGVEVGQSWLGKSLTRKSSQEFNFSFGIYLRACPSFMLKQFKKLRNKNL